MVKEIYKYGMGFWIGGFVYSLVNLIINIKLGNTLGYIYNYEIMGVSIIGFILNLVLLKRGRR